MTLQAGSLVTVTLAGTYTGFSQVSDVQAAISSELSGQSLTVNKSVMVPQDLILGTLAHYGAFWKSDYQATLTVTVTDGNTFQTPADVGTVVAQAFADNCGQDPVSVSATGGGTLPSETVPASWNPFSGFQLPSLPSLSGVTTSVVIIGAVLLFGAILINREVGP